MMLLLLGDSDNNRLSDGVICRWHFKKDQATRIIYKPTHQENYKLIHQERRNGHLRSNIVVTWKEWHCCDVKGVTLFWRNGVTLSWQRSKIFRDIKEWQCRDTQGVSSLHRTVRDSTNVMQQQNLPNMSEKLEFVENYLITHGDYLEEQRKYIKHNFSRFKSEIKGWWITAQKKERTVFGSKGHLQFRQQCIDWDDQKRCLVKQVIELKGQPKY
jgi:hypothetical protein